MAAAKATCILLIDDETALSAAIAIYLRQLDYDVRTAASGEEGIRLFREKTPDLIMTDLGLPGMGGLQVLSALKSLAPDVPVIVLSGMDSITIAVAALRSGAYDYLAKPLPTLDMLPHMIGRALEHAELRRREKDDRARLEEELERRTRQTAIELEERIRAENRLRENDSALQLLIQALAEWSGETGFSSVLEKLAAWLHAEYVGIVELFPDREMGQVHAARMDHEFFVDLSCHTGHTPLREVMDCGFLLVPRQIMQLYPEDPYLGGMRAEGYVGVALNARSGRKMGVLCAISRMPLELPPHGRQTLEVIAQRVAGELEQRGMQSRLRHAEKMRAIGELAGGIAHDFNNLLGGIMGYADLLQRRIGVDEKAAVYVNGIVQTSETAAALIQRLLSFSRKTDRLFTTVAVAEALESAVAILRHTFPGKIRLEMHIDGELSPIRADFSDLQNVIMNLALNARDAMPDGGLLRIVARMADLDDVFCRQYDISLTPGRYVRIDVIDTGPGIEPHLLPRIFEPFFSTKSVEKGTGLGLSVVYGTVHDHSGAVTVTNRPGEGCTFSLFFPEADVSELLPQREALAVGENTPGYGSVLVADSDPTFRTVAEVHLKDLGYDVLLAATGEEALAQISEQAPRVCLLDLDLQQPGGATLLSRLRELRPRLPVLLLTASWTREKENDALRFRTQGVLRKPMRMHQLDKAIRDALL